MSYVFPPSPVTAIPVHGEAALFAVHRIYCVGRNYEDHAKEMGATGREPPFFFLKPADAAWFAPSDHPADLPYPSVTHNLHHEIELVVAIGSGGSNITAANAWQHIYGFAVGLDMTRRDLQNDMKKQGRPWSIGKAFDLSAPMGAITPAAQVPGIAQAQMDLHVNGQLRQSTGIDKLIWNIAETIQEISKAWTLQPGDLIFTGTPAGVAAVVPGDVLHGRIAGLQDLQVRIV
jgi:fumarylpyruvate hydrolase